MGLETRGEESLVGRSIHMSEGLFYSKYGVKDFRREVA